MTTSPTSYDEPDANRFDLDVSVVLRCTTSRPSSARRLTAIQTVALGLLADLVVRATRPRNLHPPADITETTAA